MFHPGTLKAILIPKCAKASCFPYFNRWYALWHEDINQEAMLSNYIKLAIRLLIRNPFFTIINVLGLSVGFAAFIVLWPYAQSELKSDQFHKDAERIGRLSRNVEGKNTTNIFSINLPQQHCGVARQIANEFSDVKDLTRIVLQADFEQAKIGCDKDVFFSILNEGSIKKSFREQTTAFADPNFFRFFSFPLLEGDPESVLAQPATVVLSEKTARKYFADTNPIDKIIYLNDSVPLRVTGVFKNLPKNTHMVFDVLISTTGIKAFDLTGLQGSLWGYCYIKINEGVDFTKLQRAINKHKKRLFATCQDCPEEQAVSVFIQSLKDVIFNDLPSNSFISKSKYFLTILRALSFVILTLAWINYISLSINMLQKRLPEMGTRKVVGASGMDYVFQFLIEATIINLFSFLLALTLVQLVKAPAQQLFEFYVADWSSLSFDTIGIIVLALGLGILVTGLYPSLISLRKKPVELLKKLKLNREPWWINSVVTLQYAAAIALLIWISTVYFQLDLILSKSIGIEKNGVVIVDCPLEQKSEFKSKLAYFMDQAIHIDGIQVMTISKSVAGDYAGYGIAVKRSPNDVQWGLNTNGGVDENFIPLYGIKLVAGRNFQADRPADQKVILISKAATVRLGFANPEAAIGEKIILPWHNLNPEIIGVYEDYEFRPFFTDQNRKKGPDSFLTYKDYLIPNFYPSKISVKIDFNELASALPSLGKLYKSVFPQETFQWVFLDENITRHYTSEKISRNQIVLFTLIAVGIACLGLLGTVSNKTMEKTKEIGIRKVLGATMHQIARILLNTSIKQVIVATIISLPVSYYLTQQYLQKFSERITLQWWHYAVPIGLLLLIMLTTIASVVWKAARTNPVESLRYE